MAIAIVIGHIIVLCESLQQNIKIMEENNGIDSNKVINSSTSYNNTFAIVILVHDKNYEVALNNGYNHYYVAIRIMSKLKIKLG